MPRGFVLGGTDLGIYKSRHLSKRRESYSTAPPPMIFVQSRRRPLVTLSRSGSVFGGLFMGSVGCPFTPRRGENMVYYKTTKTTRKEYLVTVTRDDDAMDKGVKHSILPPMTGAFAEAWPPMQYPRHLDRWCSKEDLAGLKMPQPVLLPSHYKQKDHLPSFEILSTSITRKEARWSATPRFGCEFTYTPKYWEWLEDIIRQCRAKLEGAHILEVVHASLFMYSRNTSLMKSFCEHWCPKTNTLVTATGEASISLWDIRTLANLPITGLLYDEVVPALAELLDSSSDGKPHLPPSCRYLFDGFHVASLLASGQKISLAIPVLASIYRGLNDISASSVPGKNSGYFAPHYVYTWLAKFYRSHQPSTCKLTEASMAAFGDGGSLVTVTSADARDLIPSGQTINWRAISFGGVKQETHVDDAHSSAKNAEALIAIRSSFLMFRCEDSNIIESYSPHRFGRQFEFRQDYPGDLEYDIREGSNERLFQLFGSSILLETRSSFVLPKGDLRLDILTTPAYDTFVKTTFSPMFPIKKATPRKSPEEHRDKNKISLGKIKLEHRVTRTTPESPATSPPPKDKTRVDDKVRKVTPPPSKSVEKVSAPTSKIYSSTIPSDGNKSEGESILHIFDHFPESVTGVGRTPSQKIIYPSGLYTNADSGRGRSTESRQLLVADRFNPVGRNPNMQV
ncbi:hypothetical protein RND81_03G154600 [Saponaria officinalis]|uniref:Aminotransferase-like plant mobile domain-containing protein n=1 Tax=Saponaria officinalis TaxID=3572 RepID=A0AAW1M8B9_SAPOF